MKNTTDKQVFAPAVSRTSEQSISKETIRYREMIAQIEKRDGRLVPFDFDKISGLIISTTVS